MATLDIKIWDEKLRLSSDQNEEFIQRVADYLNDKMTEVYASDATLITTKIAALRAAYFIAAEYFLLKQQMGQIELTMEQIEEQIDNLLL